LFISPFFIDKTRPEIIRNKAAFAVWLRVLQLFSNVSHHEFVKKLIMQKIERAVHLHHQQEKQSKVR
jgi:c-di-GMP-related signal transduction protein